MLVIYSKSFFFCCPAPDTAGQDYSSNGKSFVVVLLLVEFACLTASLPDDECMYQLRERQMYYKATVLPCCPYFLVDAKPPSFFYSLALFLWEQSRLSKTIVSTCDLPYFGSAINQETPFILWNIEWNWNFPPPYVRSLFIASNSFYRG